MVYDGVREIASFDCGLSKRSGYMIVGTDSVL